MIDDSWSGACFRAGTGCGIGKRLLALAIFLSLLFLAANPLLWVGSARAAEVISQEQRAKEDTLWGQAQGFLAAEDDEQAALYFKYYWQTYPRSPRAEQALWQAARLYKRHAPLALSPDWGRVKDLFQAYIVDYPDSPRLAEAYFEVGNSYFQLGFYREALNYYSIFLKDYPGHDLENEVFFRRAQVYLRLDKFKLASAEFARLQGSTDKEIRLRGEIGQAHVHFFKGEWHDALGILKGIDRRNPDYYLRYPELLKYIGIATLRAGNVKEGRDHILRYLNITEPAQVDAAAFFELAESFLQEGMVDAARIFYEGLVRRNRPADKYFVLSNFRLAQYGAVNLDKMSEKERLAFFKEKGDKPFLEVLDRLYSDPLAQEARYALFKRYLERQEWDLAYNIGTAYLRYKTMAKKQLVVEQELADILIAKIGKLLDAEKYQDVRFLYEKEFPTIAACKKADLLMLIGAAYEAESLYDQASVLYYRALGLEISDEQKAKLYFRRAGVYLANNDLQAAQRLLKYLRRLYQGQAAIAEVNWLSGRLRAMQGRPEDALAFYKMAVESGGQQERKGVYAAAYLEQLFVAQDLELVADLIAMFHGQEWLPPQRIQYWYGRLGVELAKAGEKEAATAIAKRALADDLPATSPEVQPIHLHLGDLLVAQQRYPEAVVHYRLALAGEDERLAQLARTRLNEEQIRSIRVEVEGMF